MDDASLQKIALNPAIQQVLRRVGRVGLHKVAQELEGLPDITLKTAMQRLGETLMQQHLKQQKIQSGLQDFSYLEND